MSLFFLILLDVKIGLINHLAINLFLSLFYLILSDQSYLYSTLLLMTKARHDIPPLIMKTNQYPKLEGIQLINKHCKKLERGNAKNRIP